MRILDPGRVHKQEKSEVIRLADVVQAARREQDAAQFFGATVHFLGKPKDAAQDAFPETKQDETRCAENSQKTVSRPNMTRTAGRVLGFSGQIWLCHFLLILLTCLPLILSYFACGQRQLRTRTVGWTPWTPRTLTSLTSSPSLPGLKAACLFCQMVPTVNSALASCGSMMLGTSSGSS